MKPRFRRSLWVLLGLLLLCGVILLLVLPEKAKSDHVTIATAGEGGTFYPLGKRLGHLLEARSDSPVAHAVTLRTPGSSFNLELLRREKDPDQYKKLEGIHEAEILETTPGLRRTSRSWPARPWLP